MFASRVIDKKKEEKNTIGKLKREVGSLRGELNLPKLVCPHTHQGALFFFCFKRSAGQVTSRLHGQAEVVPVSREREVV